MQLQIDLEWQAKSLAFELVTKETHFLYQQSITPEGYFAIEKVGPRSHPSTDKKGSARSTVDYTMLVRSEKFKVLSRDKKFMALSKNIGREYERAFSKLSESA